MAIRIYRKGNYIWVFEQGVTVPIEGLCPNVLVNKTIDGDSYSISGLNKYIPPKDISEILKENGDPYTQSEFEEFYTKNTGETSLSKDFIIEDVNRITGVIDGINQEVTLECQGASSAIVIIDGTFTGTLRSVGTNQGIEGGRLLFKSGVGSIGTNEIIGDNTLFRREYRIIAGGDNYSIKSNGTFTGSVTVTIISSTATHSIFVNGGVNTVMETATKDGRAYLASTGTQSVLAGNIIACKLFNPSNSGVNITVVNRLFGNNTPMTGDNLEYIAYANPDIILPNQSNGINLKAGSDPSVAQFSWTVDAQANIDMGGTQGSGEILPRGMPYNRELDFLIPPGGGLGFTITGAGNNVLQAVRISIILEWYQETVN